MKNRRCIGRLLLLLSFLLSACSSTTINGVWKDPKYQTGPVNQLLVVSVAKKDLMRRLYEDAFVDQLQSHGITATPGYRVLPVHPGEDPSSARNLLADNHYRFLLITRLAERKTVEILHPGTARIDHYPGRYSYYRHSPYYRHWQDYYDSSYSIIETTPPHTSLNELIILETNLYDADDEIIFSVQTETLVDFGAEKTIHDIVKTVINALDAHDLL